MGKHLSEYTPISGAVATVNEAGATAIGVEDACKVIFQFERVNHTAGSSVFTVMGSLDGTNYVTLNVLVDNVANTNAQNYTRVGSVTLTTNSKKFYALDLEHFHFNFIKVLATRVTDGTNTAKVYILR